MEQPSVIERVHRRAGSLERQFRLDRHAPYERYKGSNMVHRQGTLWRVPTCRVTRDYNMPISAPNLQSWSEIDPVDVVVVRGAHDECEWFVRVHNTTNNERHKDNVNSINKFLVPIPARVAENMVELMRNDDKLRESSLLTEFSRECHAHQIKPQEGGWLVETQTHDGTPTTRHRLQQITREAADLVTMMTDSISYPGDATSDPIVDWSQVRAVEREREELQEEEERAESAASDREERETQGTWVPAALYESIIQEMHALRRQIIALRRENGDGVDSAELALREQLRRLRSGEISVEQSREDRLRRVREETAAEEAAEEEAETEPEAEMSDEEEEEDEASVEADSDDDAEYSKSTREHLVTAEQGLKEAMVILDDIKDVPGVSENDYLKAANLMRASFMSIKALAKRIDVVDGASDHARM